MLTERETDRLIDTLKDGFGDDWDLVDIKAEIDSTLTYHENLAYIKAKYMMMLGREDGIRAEIESYQKSLVDAIPIGDSEFNDLMNNIRDLLESPTINPRVKTRLVSEIKDKISELDHLKDSKKDDISRYIKEYMIRVGLI